MENRDIIPNVPMFACKIFAEDLKIDVASPREDPTIGIKFDINLIFLVNASSAELPKIFWIEKMNDMVVPKKIRIHFIIS